MIPTITASTLSAGEAPTVLVVTTTSDLGTTGDGLCSLREAIESVNVGQQVDTCGPGGPGDPLPASEATPIVELPAGIFRLESFGRDEDLNQTGDLDILSPVILQGVGESETVLDGELSDRVLDLRFASPFQQRVEIHDLTTRRGDPGPGVDGGCVRSIYTETFFSRVTIAECEIEASEVVGEFGSGGGLVVEGGLVELRRVQVVDNTAQKGGGGGVFVVDATVSVVDSTIARNRALMPSGTVSGGGLSNLSGSVSILRSSVTDNEVVGQAGGLFCFAIGERTMNVMSSTIARNRATGSGGGIRSVGDLTLTNVTVTGNVADSDGNGSGRGGGIRLGNGAFLLMKGTIVAWNQDHTPDPEDLIHPEISGTVTSAGFNLVLDDEGTEGIVDGSLGDVVGVDPLFDLPTGEPEHYPLLPASPATDQIPRASCTAVSVGDNPDWGNGSSVLMDQRGVGRGTFCEKGAFEDRPPEIFDDDLESGTVDSWTSTVP